jgi:hypothetical protein
VVNDMTVVASVWTQAQLQERWNDVLAQAYGFTFAAPAIRRTASTRTTRD